MGLAILGSLGDKPTISWFHYGKHGNSYASKPEIEEEKGVKPAIIGKFYAQKETLLQTSLS